MLLKSAQINSSLTDRDYVWTIRFEFPFRDYYDYLALLQCLSVNLIKKPAHTAPRLMFFGHLNVSLHMLLIQKQCQASLNGFIFCFCFKKSSTPLPIF